MAFTEHVILMIRNQWNVCVKCKSLLRYITYYDNQKSISITYFMCKLRDTDEKTCYMRSLGVAPMIISHVSYIMAYSIMLQQF